jgi:hypothetical protein
MRRGPGSVPVHNSPSHSAAQRWFQIAEHHNMICQSLAERTEPTSKCTHVHTGQSGGMVSVLNLPESGGGVE